MNSQHLSDHSSHGVRDSIAAAELQEASIPGQARSAILSAQLARIRQDRTDAVTGAAHAMVILQSKTTQLRDAGIKSAVREMALRHQCAELQQSNEAWMRESSQARASSISGAFDSLDADALAAGIFKAETQGIFSCERGVDGLLRDIKLARAGKSKFRKTPLTEAFFTKLAVKGGPALALWVSETLGEGAPVVSEHRIRGFQRKHPNVEIGHNEAAITTNVTRAIQFYEKHGIHTDDTDYVVDEDATAHGKHVEVTAHKENIRAFGINGGPYDITSKRELISLVQKHGLSSTTYVHLLVPQTRKTPTFPIAMSESDNKFDNGMVHGQQMLILRVFKKVTGLSSLHTFDSDGDPRLRRQYLMMQFNDNLAGHACLDLTHGMIRVRVPYITGYGYVFFDQCDMHCAWRFAIQYLKLKKSSSPSFMRLGPFRYNPGDFQRAAMSQKLPDNRRQTAAPFGAHDKQNGTGCRRKGGLNKEGQRLADSENFLITLWNDPTELHLRPDILYHMTLGKYISQNVDKRLTIMQRAESVGFVLEFLSLSYQLAVETVGACPKQTWLTRETATDMLVGLMLKILLLKYYRMKGRMSPPTFERIAPKMLEFFFQQIRSYDRNSSKFTFFQVQC